MWPRDRWERDEEEDQDRAKRRTELWTLDRFLGEWLVLVLVTRSSV